MSRVTLLQHRGTSWLHQLHPLVKLAWLLVLGVSAFIYSSPAYILALLAAVLIAMILAGINPWRNVRGSGLLLWTGLFLFGLQALFHRGGRELINLWPSGRAGWPVTAEGVSRGVVIGARFLVIVLSSQLFVLVTDPSALAYALMRVGLPYRYGFALVTALRLVPVFEEEANIVYQAQLTRGVRYDAHALRRLYELLRQFMLPMLVSALRKVDALAISMEGRHFGRYPTRTFLRQPRLGREDWLASLALAIFMGVTAYLRVTF